MNLIKTTCEYHRNAMNNITWAGFNTLNGENANKSACEVYVTGILRILRVIIIIICFARSSPVHIIAR